MNTQNWNRLLYQGLQAGGAAFIVSAALSQASRRLLIQYAGSQSQFDLTMWTLVGSWFFVGLLCLAPLAWAVKKRLESMLGFSAGYSADNPAHLWSCREAAAFSLFASPLWWLAPALTQISGR